MAARKRHQQRGQALSLPRLLTLRFRDLAVNSTRPSEADLDSQWMSSNDGLVGPSSVQEDSFALRRQTLSPAGRRYLIIVSAASPGIETFSNHIARWTGATPASQIASATSGFVTAERNNINALAATRWPPAAQPLIDLNIREKQREINQARSAVTPAGLAAWKAAMISDLETSRRTVRQLRRALDLPRHLSRHPLTAAIWRQVNTIPKPVAGHEEMPWQADATASPHRTAKRCVY